MSRCPNCSYGLVLLEKRRKYKCAKCSKLYPKLSIDNKDFREMNKIARVQDKIEAEKQRRKDYNLNNIEKVKKWAKKYYKKNKNKIKQYYKQKKINTRKKENMSLFDFVKKENNKESQREHYHKNRNKEVQRKRDYRKNLSKQKRQEQNNKRNARRSTNIEDTRLNGRINHWRQKQKKLALKKLEFAYEKALNLQFQQILPTKLLF